MNIKSHFHYSYRLGNSKVFRSSMPETGQQLNMYLITNHNISTEFAKECSETLVPIKMMTI